MFAGEGIEYNSRELSFPLILIFFFFFLNFADKFISLRRAAHLGAIIGKTQVQPSQVKAAPTTTLPLATLSLVTLPMAFQLALPVLELLMPPSSELVLIQ